MKKPATSDSSLDPFTALNIYSRDGNTNPKISNFSKYLDPESDSELLHNLTSFVNFKCFEKSEKNWQVTFFEKNIGSIPCFVLGAQITPFTHF